MIYEIDGQGELLECLDILMAAAEFAGDVSEHRRRVVAFYNHYDDPPIESDIEELQDWWAEYELQLDVLTSLSPRPDYSDDELQTAYWQTAQLSMMLLTEFVTLLDVHEGRTQELIKPQQGLSVPKKELIVP